MAGAQPLIIDRAFVGTKLKTVNLDRSLQHPGRGDVADGSTITKLILGENSDPTTLKNCFNFTGSKHYYSNQKDNPDFYRGLNVTHLEFPSSLIDIYEAPVNGEQFYDDKPSSIDKFLMVQNDIKRKPHFAYLLRAVDRQGEIYIDGEKASLDMYENYKRYVKEKIFKDYYVKTVDFNNFNSGFGAEDIYQYCEIMCEVVKDKYEKELENKPSLSNEELKSLLKIIKLFGNAMAKEPSSERKVFSINNDEVLPYLNNPVLRDKFNGSAAVYETLLKITDKYLNQNSTNILYPMKVKLYCLYGLGRKDETKQFLPKVKAVAKKESPYGDHRQIYLIENWLSSSGNSWW